MLPQKGEVANRILTVGSTQRAEMLSQLLQPLSPGTPMVQRLSSRGFMTITGWVPGLGGAGSGVRVVRPHIAPLAA